MPTNTFPVNSYFGRLSSSGSSQEGPTGPTGANGKSVTSATSYESSIKGITAYLNAANKTQCTPVITTTNNYGQTSLNYVYFFTDVSGGTFKITDASSGICNVSAYLVGAGTPTQYQTVTLNGSPGVVGNCGGAGQYLFIPTLPLTVGTEYIVQPGMSLSIVDASNTYLIYTEHDDATWKSIAPYDISGNSYIKDPSVDASNNGIIAAAASGPFAYSYLVTVDNVARIGTTYYSPYGYPNGSSYSTTVPEFGILSSYFSLNNVYISPNSYLNPSNYGFYTSNTYLYNENTSPTINLGNLLYSPNQSLTLNLTFSNFVYEPATNLNGVLVPNGYSATATNTGGSICLGAQGQIVIVVTYVDTQVNNTLLTNPFN